MKPTPGPRLRVCILVLAAVLLTAALALSALAAEEPEVMRVAFPQVPGYTTTSADGQRQGLVVDYLNEIAKYTGWKYEYIDVDNESMLDRFFNGEFDLMGGTYYLDGYEQYFAYPDYNCGYVRMILLARKSDSSIHSYDVSTFNGKTIGVYERATENIRRLKEYLSIQNVDCEIKYFSAKDLSEDGTLYRFLENGEVDLLVGNSAEVSDLFYTAASVDSQAHYIVTTPGNQSVLDGLNMALQHIYASDPNFALTAYAANFQNVTIGFTDLSEEEQAYIEEKGTVTIAVPENWHPLFCLDNSDTHNGLVPDILQHITDSTGLKFTYLRCGSYTECIDKVRRGEADLLGFFVGTEEDALDQSLALTASYAELDSVLVRNKESSYPAEGLVGGILEGCGLPADIIAVEVRSYSDITQALSDVNRGKIDFFYGISAQLEDIIQQQNFTNLVPVSLANSSLEMSFAVVVPVQPELFTILDKVINGLTKEERSAFVSRNVISIGVSRMSLSGLIYSNPALVVTVAVVFLLLVLAVVILVYSSRLRAAKMRMELEKAEAGSRAKSDFLSRMSHEIRTPMNAIVGLADLTEMTRDLPEDTRKSLGKIKSSAHYLLSLINDILDMSRIENGKMEIASETFSLRAALEEVENLMRAESLERGLTFRIETRFQDDVLVGDAIRLRQVILNLLSNAFKFTSSGGSVLVRVTQDASTDRDAAFTIRVIDTGVGIAPEDEQRIFRSFEQLGSNYSKSQGTGLGLAISSSIVQLMGGELKLNSELGEGSEFYFTVTLPKGDPAMLPGEKQVCAGDDMFRGIRVLVAEDNDLNAEIALELLHVQGAEADREANGKAALERFQSSEPGTYHAILMDIMMPEMNGLEATRAIRALPRPDAGIPIIAMTANAFREDVQTALEAGMNGFVPKPIDVAYLYEELGKALGQTPVRKS